MSKWKKEGVGLIVRDPKKRILTLKERRPNLRVGKLPGMRGFALETREPGETVHATLGRIPGEEMPGISVNWPPEYIGEYHIFGEISADIFQATTNSDELPRMINEDPEVDDYRWESVEEALGTLLRPGLRGILADLLLSDREMARAQPMWLQSMAAK